ncbi:patched domain-containing protein 3-like [Ptychodera flava]|uniref:patched domain-containing protein 3-like n=1 Tax=Ptychodera flava TaxID=63121 RepID=UPI00396A3F65
MEYLYTPENSQADQDRDRVKELFEDRSGTDFYAHQMATLGVYAEIYVLPPNQHENVLTAPILEELLILDKIITGVTETVDGELYTYDDLCARRTGDCVVSGILNLINGTDVDTFLSEPIPYPIAIGVNGEPISLPSLLGGETLSEDGNYVIGADVLRIRYHLMEGDDIRRIGLMWERAFLDKMSTVETNFSQFYYSVSESLNYELDEAIGVDDMFLIMAGWLESKQAATTERVSKAFGVIGVSITITSLTDALAFSIGAANVFPSVRIFAFIRMMFFGGNLELHNRRVADNRHCITCQIVPSDDELTTEERSSLYICCCRGKKSDGDEETVFERIPKKYLPKMVLYTPVKICILIIFAAYLGVAIWGCTLLQEGLLLNNLVPPSSYLYTYLHIQAEYFTEGAVVYNVIDGPVEYWTTDVQQQINKLLVDFNEDEFFKDDFRLSWLDAFSSSMNGTLPSDKASFLDALQTSFSQTTQCLRET